MRRAEIRKLPAMKPNSALPCPCSSGRTYAECCGRWHAGDAAPDAEALMRSRYSAYVLGLSNYLIATWHVSTRPAALDLLDGPTWLGLSVASQRAIDPLHAEVEFIARFRVGGGRASRLHERSRFIREEGRWFYVDGEIHSEN